MNQKVAVIGLGRFGQEIAMQLAERRMDVLAVDNGMKRIEAISRFVTRAVCLDSTDEEALAGVNIHEMDIAICAIGEKYMENSILTTALLKQFQVPRIIARALEPLHERILRLVGATEIVNPEREIGRRIAYKIATPGIIETIPLAEGVSMSEIHIPESFVGRGLAELDIRKKFQVNVVALKRQADDRAGREQLTINPDPISPLRGGDVLVVVGRLENIERINRIG